MLLVQVYRNLRVTPASESVAFGAQLLSDRVVSIELTVHDGMYVTFGIMERLLSFRAQVDNGETVVAKSWR